MEQKGSAEGITTDAVYNYDQAITLDGTIYTVTANGSTGIWQLRTPQNTIVKIRAYREKDDPEGEVRLYNNVRESYTTAPTGGEWVQIPETQTDVMTTGDMMNGTITFRTHLEVEPLPVG